MAKIRYDKFILFLLLIAVLFIVTSCAKAQCKTSSDCASRICAVSKCEDKKCVYTQQNNCCGNRINETIESGRPGNKCTCPQDYGKCDGKPKVKVGSKMQDAAYAIYHCNDFQECVIGVSEKDISPQNILDSININYFKASSIIRYNHPFEISRNAFEIKFTLDDVEKELLFPIELKKIKILYSGESLRSEQLIAEHDLDILFQSIGEETTITAHLNLGYKPRQIEESGSFKYVIDYSHVKNVQLGRGSDGSISYSQETVRNQFTSTPKKVFFVSS